MRAVMGNNKTMTKHATATPWDPETIASYDVRRHVPPHVVDQINTPHDHENAEGNRPLWIIWAVPQGKQPVIDTICDTPDSAVYHYGAVVESNPTWIRTGALAVHVERVPANHRFASSMSDVFVGGSTLRTRTPRRYRQGD